MTLNAAPDLRRRHAREAAERITARCQWLAEADRQLLLSVYGDGKSMKDLASLLCVSPRVMRTRVRRLVMRVSSELFQFVALHHECWPANLRRVAESCVFRGRSIKGASRELGVSYHHVRRHIDVVRAMLQTSRASSSSGPSARPGAVSRRGTLAAPGSRPSSLRGPDERFFGGDEDEAGTSMPTLGRARTGRDGYAVLARTGGQVDED